MSGFRRSFNIFSMGANILDNELDVYIEKAANLPRYSDKTRNVIEDAFTIEAIKLNNNSILKHIDFNENNETFLKLVDKDGYFVRCYIVSRWRPIYGAISNYLIIDDSYFLFDFDKVMELNEKEDERQRQYEIKQSEKKKKAREYRAKRKALKDAKLMSCKAELTNRVDNSPSHKEHEAQKEAHMKALENRKKGLTYNILRDAWVGEDEDEDVSTEVAQDDDKEVRWHQLRQRDCVWNITKQNWELDEDPDDLMSTKVVTSEASTDNKPVQISLFDD